MRPSLLRETRTPSPPSPPPPPPPPPPRAQGKKLEMLEQIATVFYCSNNLTQQFYITLHQVYSVVFFFLILQIIRYSAKMSRNALKAIADCVELLHSDVNDKIQRFTDYSHVRKYYSLSLVPRQTLGVAIPWQAHLRRR